MAKLKFTIHPLFFLFGIYFALIGKVFSFLAFTVVALIHEIGHSIVAANLGYKLNRVVLMPYGATISGEQELFSYADEIKIAIAGPAINLFIVIFFVCIWWFTPDTYPYTELAVFASLSIAIINLLPCFPLDGGRILLATLSIFLDRKTAVRLVKLSGLLVSLCLLGLFIYSCFFSINISLLFFCLFMLFGDAFVSRDNVYIRIFSGFNYKVAEKGREIKRIAVCETSKIKTLYKFINSSNLIEIVVLDKTGKEKYTLPVDKVYKLLGEAKLYLSLGAEVERLDLI